MLGWSKGHGEEMLVLDDYYFLGLLLGFYFICHVTLQFRLTNWEELSDGHGLPSFGHL